MAEAKEIFSTRKLRNKRDFYTLYSQGLLGNKVKTWSSPEQIYNDGWKGKVCIRARNGTKRKNTRYDVPLEKLEEEIDDLKSIGFSEQDLTFNQDMPNHCLTIQGELSLSTNHYTLTYTTIKKPMNHALKEESRTATGLKAKLLLRQNFDPSTLSDIESLFELFPNSTIEFSSYQKNVGEIPGRNTVIWEVRNY